MDVEWLTAVLARSPVPWTVEAHPALPSTNTLALERARPWRVVVTDHQTQGRGRLDRAWQTPAGVALTLSATVPLVRGGWLPLAAGVAVAQALEAHAGLATGLKWPNDVLVPADGHRKVAGILCEVAPVTSDGGPVAVVGIGVNLSQTRAQLPTSEATSVVLAGGRVQRAVLLAGILESLAPLHADLAAGGERASGVAAAYRERCATIGAPVRLTRPDGPDVLGDAVAVDDDGRLVVRGPTGERPWAAGDVTHLRPHRARSPEVGRIPP